MFEREGLTVDHVLKFLKFYEQQGLTLANVIEVLEYDRNQLVPESELFNQSQSV